MFVSLLSSTDVTAVEANYSGSWPLSLSGEVAMRQHHNNGRNRLSLEAKVRAIKLLKIDGVEPQDILTDLENTFGVKIAHSNRERPKRFLKRIEKSLINLCAQEGPHTQRLIKLLKQAQLIQAGDDHE